jgi:hypothetical protein
MNEERNDSASMSESTCRPAGTLELLGMWRAMNMSRRWRFHTVSAKANWLGECYRHVAPLAVGILRGMQCYEHVATLVLTHYVRNGEFAQRVTAMERLKRVHCSR